MENTTLSEIKDTPDHYNCFRYESKSITFRERNDDQYAHKSYILWINFSLVFIHFYLIQNGDVVTKVDNPAISSEFLSKIGLMLWQNLSWTDVIGGVTDVWGDRGNVPIGRPYPNYDLLQRHCTILFGSLVWFTNCSRTKNESILSDQDYSGTVGQ